LADDGSQKHIIFNTPMGEMLKFNLDGSFPVGWPLYFDTVRFGNDPVILDIDHDGRFEMFSHGWGNIGGMYQNLLFLVNDDGAIMPGFPISMMDPYRLAAADIDNDNEYEIFYFSTREGVVNCLDRYGVPKPGWPIPLPYDDLMAGGSIGDLDLDGTNELVLPGYRNIYAYRHDGSMMDGFPITLEDTTLIFQNGNWPCVLVDFDLDGYLEIIMAGNNWVAGPPPDYMAFVGIYEYTGEPKEGWSCFRSELFISPVTPADLNNDGILELGFQGYHLHFVDQEAVELPGWPVRLSRPDGGIRASYSDLSIVDLDGDGDCEIFTDYNLFYTDSSGHSYSYLFGIDHFGQPLVGYPIEVAGEYLGRPPVFSLDRFSSRLYMSLSSDILGSGDSVFLELFRFPDSTGPTDQWPMLHHDNLHTRNYNFVDQVTSTADDDKEILPQTPVLMQNYPNPFNYSTMIQFILPGVGSASLSVYDVGGRKMQVTMPGVASGVYFMVLKTEKAQITRKMLYLK
jgi:hypothetical protein